MKFLGGTESDALHHVDAEGSGFEPLLESEVADFFLRVATETQHDLATDLIKWEHLSYTLLHDTLAAIFSAAIMFFL